jgi:hypothetical protein
MIAPMMLSTTPISDFTPRYRSEAASDSPAARIGPINGDTSIAPITTAGLFSTSPSVAIPADRISSSP